MDGFPSRFWSVRTPGSIQRPIFDLRTQTSMRREKTATGGFRLSQGLTTTSSRREKITTGGFSQFSASGGLQRAPGPLKNDAGRKTGPREGLQTAKGRRCEKNATSGVRDWCAMVPVRSAIGRWRSGVLYVCALWFVFCGFLFGAAGRGHTHHKIPSPGHQHHRAMTIGHQPYDTIGHQP